MEVSTVVVSACVAAAACAGAYVLWGPDQLWKRPGTACVCKHEVARIQGSIARHAEDVVCSSARPQPRPNPPMMKDGERVWCWV